MNNTMIEFEGSRQKPKIMSEQVTSRIKEVHKYRIRNSQKFSQENFNFLPADYKNTPIKTNLNPFSEVSERSKGSLQISVNRIKKKETIRQFIEESNKRTSRMKKLTLVQNYQDIISKKAEVDMSLKSTRTLILGKAKKSMGPDNL
mmetsp:Transcript_13677/g.12128  ORF Transcript_13677/g.12128 Transcript_13677/m.12128 type:complete len:146 (-) Transcript_13677:152-589(-)